MNVVYLLLRCNINSVLNFRIKIDLAHVFILIRTALARSLVSERFRTVFRTINRSHDVPTGAKSHNNHLLSIWKHILNYRITSVC